MDLNDPGTARQGMLAPGMVVVRWMALDGLAPEAEAGWRGVLDDAERGRADRFHFAQDRTAFVAAHALTRTMLSRWGGLPPARWRFVTGAFGKPELDPALSRPALRFNLSHTRGLVACAVTRSADLGIDVEGLQRQVAIPEIAERFFTSAETASLAGAAPGAQAAVFFRLWTLKEAVMKATGRGFDLPLDGFSVGLDPPSVRFAADSEGLPADWQLLCRPVGEGHMLAVAVRGRRPATFDVQEVARPRPAGPTPSSALARAPEVTGL